MSKAQKCQSSCEGYAGDSTSQTRPIPEQFIKYTTRLIRTDRYLDGTGQKAPELVQALHFEIVANYSLNREDNLDHLVVNGRGIA